MAWITTKTGKHINTDWFDDEKAKEKQIAKNKAQADELNGKLNDPVSLINKNSYIYDPEYKATAMLHGDVMKKMNELDDQITELRKQLKKELIVDPELGRQMSELFGNYTDKGKELNSKIDSLREERSKAEKEWMSMRDKLQAKAKANSNTQKEQYKNRKEDTVSTKVKEDYPGFEKDRSTTPYIDEKLAKGDAYVVEMSPKQYLQECAYKIFPDSTFEKQVQSTAWDNYANPKKYARQMREGTKFHTPYLNYENSQQEGRNRAVAAYINGYDKIPVIIVPKKRR